MPHAVDFGIDGLEAQIATLTAEKSTLNSDLQTEKNNVQTAENSVSTKALKIIELQAKVDAYENGAAPCDSSSSSGSDQTVFLFTIILLVGLLLALFAFEMA